METSEAIQALQRASAAVTSTWNLDQVLVAVEGACSEELGYVYPSLALLESRGDQISGRVLSSAKTRESIQNAKKVTAVPLDNFFGLGTDRRARVRPETPVLVQPEALLYRPDETENFVVRAYMTRTPLITTRYHDIVRPHVEPQAAEAAQKALGLSSIALVPLVAGEKCWGVLTVSTAPPRSITGSDLPALGLLATQAAAALALVHLHRDLKDREQQVHVLLEALIDAQETERERICLEIHDGVAQTLAPAFHYLQALESRPDFPIDARPEIRKVGTLVKSAIREAREVIASLRPASLDSLGLVATLRYEMKEITTESGLRVEFDADPLRLPTSVETALYRIIHEAINNATRHAEAHCLIVRLKQADGRIVIDVRDDGVGFDAWTLQRQLPRKGVGLLGIRKRVELLNGNLRLTSTPGKGTQMRVEIPLPGIVAGK